MYSTRAAIRILLISGRCSCFDCVAHYLAMAHGADPADAHVVLNVEIL